MPRIGPLRSTALALVVSHAFGALDALAAQPARAPAPGAMWLRVVDAEQEPLSGAEIVLSTLGVSMKVPEGGALVVTGVPAGVYLVQARKVGYAPAWRTLRVGRDTIAAQLALGALGQPLAPVDVNAKFTPMESRLIDFERRRTQSTFGQFVTRDEIDARHPHDVATILRWTRGVQVVTGPGAARVASRRPTSVRCSGMLVYLDGVRVSGGSSVGSTVSLNDIGRAGTGTAQLFDINSIPTSLLAGVEVYTGTAGIPPEYASSIGAECGVILLWTGAR